MSTRCQGPRWESGQRSGRKRVMHAGARAGGSWYLHAQSPHSFTHVRLSTFSRNPIKKCYVFRRCFNLSTPYSDFPRTQASKEGNASGLGVQLPRLPEHSPTDVTRSCLREWAQHRREAKFWSDLLHICLPLGSGVWPQGLPGSAGQRLGSNSSSLKAE